MNVFEKNQIRIQAKTLATEYWFPVEKDHLIV